MKRSRIRCAALAGLLTFLLVFSAGPTVSANEHDDHDFSLDDAIALVRDKSGGKVLRAETRHHDNEVLHEIRVLTENGHVRTYIVDGHTGKVK